MTEFPHAYFDFWNLHFRDTNVPYTNYIKWTYIYILTKKKNDLCSISFVFKIKECPNKPSKLKVNSRTLFVIKTLWDGKIDVSCKRKAKVIKKGLPAGTVLKTDILVHFKGIDHHHLGVKDRSTFFGGKRNKTSLFLEETGASPSIRWTGSYCWSLTKK